MEDEKGTIAVADTRRRLIDAARQLFLERGYPGVTVHAIAGRAGFSTGALYGQFEGKDDLLSEAIADAINTQVHDYLQRVLPGRAPAEATRKLLVDAFSRPVEPVDVVVMHGLAATNGEGREVLRTQLMPIVDTVRDLLERGRKDGVIDPELDSEALVRMTAALAFGSMALKMLDLPAPDDKALAEVIGRFEGMLAPGSEPGS